MSTELRTGEALKATRQSLGLTQRQLAQQLGVSEQSISDWECGRKPCALPGLLRLAIERLQMAPIPAGTAPPCADPP